MLVQSFGTIGRLISEEMRCKESGGRKKKELEQKQIYPTLGVGYNKVNGAPNSFDFVI